jgi:hypothetical protein
MRTGNPLDTVQVEDVYTGEYLPIDEVVAQYRKAKVPQGRPGTYDPEFHPRAAFLLCAEFGAQLDQLARHFGVTMGTVQAWQWRYSVFASALKNGWSLHMVYTAERALVRRACGYRYEEVRRARVPIYDTVFNDKGTPCRVVVGYEEVVVERTTKEQAPDSTALMFLLQNRDGHRWRNVRKVEHTGTVEHTMPGAQGTTPAQGVIDLTTEELEQVATAMARVGLLGAQATGNTPQGNEVPA